MSLLNQVLQDLDAREAEVPVKPVLEAVEGPPTPAAQKNRVAQPDWLRRSVWGVLLLLVGAYLVYLFVYEPGQTPAAGPSPGPARAPVAAPDLAAPAAAAPATQMTQIDTQSEPESTSAVIDGGQTGPSAENAEPKVAAQPARLKAIDVPERRIEPAPAATSPDGAATPSEPARLAKPRAAVKREALVAKRSHSGPPTLAPAAWLAEAKRYWAQGRIASAEQRLRLVLKYRPQDLAAHELLTVLLVRGDRLEEAERQVELGLRHHPQQASLVMLQARLQAQRGDLLAAAATLEQSELGTSGGQEILAMLAPLYQQLGNHRQSVAVYRQLLAQVPNHGAYWAGLGLGLEALGERAAAAQAFEQALNSPGLPDTVADYVRQRRSLLE